LNFGICNLSIVPVRKEANDRSEQVTQLLFGETFKILAEEKKWMRISITHDLYEGLIDKNQFQPIDQSAIEKNQAAENAFVFDIAGIAINDNMHIPIVMGSTLPYFDGMNFKLDKTKFVFNGNVVIPSTLNGSRDKAMEKVAVKFHNSPYLWGGRTPFGVDCSGFTQIVFKMIGVQLMRDAYQQAEQGTLLNMIGEARLGDLAFFDNEEGKITHVGIILNENKIIHASGRVRIDRIDHYGIYNEEKKKYSHKLRLIKRIF